MNSIEARVRMLTESLNNAAFLASATCPKAIEMFLRLERDQDNAMQPKKKHRYVHNFDSMTYGFFYMTVAKFKPIFETAPLQPMYYGRG